MDSSSESEEDSVLHPKGTYPAAGLHGHISDRTLSSDYSEFSDADEQELTLSTECLDSGAFREKHDAVLESCGILATFKPRVEDFAFLDGQPQKRYDTEVDDFVLDAMKRAASSRPPKAEVRPPSMPQIHISTESNLAARLDDGCSPGKAAVSRKLSKSSEDLDFRPCLATSHEVSHLLVQEEVLLDTAKMKTSHSESAIQDFSLNLSSTLSPIAIKKDLVLSPLSRIAKGVQNFGMNLRPGHRHSPDTEDYERMRQRRKACATRIIEL